MPKVERFIDDQTWLYDYADLFLVHCPRCDGCAKVFLKDQVDLNNMNASRKYATLVYGERRLVCTNCAFVDEWQGNRVAFSVTHDWFFERPLWLLMPCCGETLSAFNERHLDFLAKFVTAKLRVGTRGNTHTLANTLPKWIQLSQNRADALKCLEKMRATIPR